MMLSHWGIVHSFLEWCTWRSPHSQGVYWNLGVLKKWHLLQPFQNKLSPLRCSLLRCQESCVTLRLRCFSPICITCDIEKCRFGMAHFPELWWSVPPDTSGHCLGPTLFWHDATNLGVLVGYKSCIGITVQRIIITNILNKLTFFLPKRLEILW